MDWLQDILAPLIVLLIAAIGILVGWFIRSKFEESRAVRQKLNEERRKNYGEIMLSLIRVLASVNRKEDANKAVEQIDLDQFQKTG